MTTEKQTHQKPIERRILDNKKEREVLLKLLEGDSIGFEKMLQDGEELPLGAVCRGPFLLERGYTPVGQNRLFGMEKSGGHYLFVAVREVESKTVTAMPNHPVYELEAKNGR
jgi:hypothetical protein